jgi:hypothetical protein
LLANVCPNVKFFFKSTSDDQLCVASTSNNNIAPTAQTGTAPVSIEEKFVVANDAIIVDSVNRNIEVAKFHINIEVF